jgi:hypothetical protein
VRVSGATTTDYEFNGVWQLTGGVVSTLVSPDTELVQPYDANWQLQTSEEYLLVTGQAAPQVFAAAPGIETVYVFQPGQIDGDVFTGFVTAAADPAVHDVLELSGFGAGAALTRIDSSHWQVTAPGLASEVFSLAGALSPAAGDVVFR